MLSVPAAIFMMGSKDDPDARPVHRAGVSAFEIDATEVTVKDYRRCVDAQACEKLEPFGTTCNIGLPGRGNHPMNCVDWSHAQSFCRWAGKRLPTEEEWEYAARGSDGRRYPWGDAKLDTQACWRRPAKDSDDVGTCEVGSHPAGDSPFGVHDMAGNVWEWTASGFSANYSGPRRSELRVIRGGSWTDVDPDSLRSTTRGRWDPKQRTNLTGIRCVRSK